MAPIREYECPRLHVTERIERASDAQLDLCPECGLPVRKVPISGGVGAQFNGSGFYQTDYWGFCPRSKR